MKKILIAIIGILLVFTCCCVIVKAEEEPVSPATVVVEPFNNGEYEISATEGNVGDVITLQLSPKLFYKISYVKVNGVDLVESETTSGLYTFSLVEGKNTISILVVLDEELLGGFTEVYEKVIDEKGEWSWENVFTLETVLTILKWILDGGILIAFARYFIKDKELNAKVEKGVTESVNKILPEATKQTVLETVEKNMAPLFEKYGSDINTLQDAMSIFAKCFALSQENTSEAKLAILQALDGLKLSDKASINQSKEYITKMASEAEAKYQEAMNKLAEIENKNQAVIEETAPLNDGTTI